MSINSKDNKSICPYPWMHSYIGARYGKKLCCISKNLEGMKKISDKEFWNCQKMKDIRLAMIKGEKIPECEPCHTNEKNGIKSLRETASIQYDYIYDTLEDVTDIDGSTNQPITYFDYRTIYCNLQCVSCGDIFSTKQISLSKKMKRYHSSFKIDKSFEQKMINDILESLDKQHCASIYWAGGEPMISKMHWDIISKIQTMREDLNTRKYANSIKMHYNTNLTKLFWKDQLIPEILQPNKPFILASLDGINETLEYTRDGAKWEDIEKNWKTYYNYLPDVMGISPILSAPVLLDIERFIDFFNPYNCFCYTHQYLGNVEDHNAIGDFLNIRFFPKHIAKRVINKSIQKFQKSNFKFLNDPIQILKFYKNNLIQQSDRRLSIIKKNIIYRDKFLITTKSFGDLLKTLDKESYEWYESIIPDGGYLND